MATIDILMWIAIFAVGVFFVSLVSVILVVLSYVFTPRKTTFSKCDIDPRNHPAYRRTEGGGWIGNVFVEDD